MSNDNIIQFTGVTTHRVPVSTVMENCNNADEVLIIKIKDGAMDVFWSGEGRTFEPIGMLESAKFIIMGSDQ